MEKFFRKIFRKFKRFFRKLRYETDLGRFGEEVACEFLKKKGFKILKRNWIFGHGEIDVIAVDKLSGNLVFVEVKLRDAEALVQGYFSVTKKKKDILRKTCKAFLRKYAKQGTSYRLDVVEIALNKLDSSYEISHFENVSLF